MGFLSKLLSSKNVSIQAPKKVNDGEKTTQKNDSVSQSKQSSDSTALKGLGTYGMALVKKPKKETVSEEKKNEILNLNEQEKKEKLDKAGFTEDVIANFKKESGFYGPELVDEALNMAIYLDSEYEQGTEITKKLLDNVIDAFSPGASGGSASVQRSILANTWTHGDEIFKAFGQIPPTKTKEIENLPPEIKQEKLDKAGFTKEVIEDLKKESTFYGPKLVDEALNMAIYLDSEYEKGTEITEKLLDDVINAFSPGASGCSAMYQLHLLAETWTHGKIIKKVYK